MTTNQTIDGVPREDLQELHVILSDMEVQDGSVYADIRDRLRALLDAPAVQWLAMEVNGKPWVIKEGPNADKWRAMGYELFPVEPAAQPQGEPVDITKADQIYAVIERDHRMVRRTSFENVCDVLRATPEIKPEPVLFVRPQDLDLAKAMRSEISIGARYAELNEYTVPLYVEQPAPVVLLPERLVMTDGLHTYEYVTGHNAAIDKMFGVKS